MTHIRPRLGPMLAGGVSLAALALALNLAPVRQQVADWMPQNAPGVEKSRVERPEARGDAEAFKSTDLARLREERAPVTQDAVSQTTSEADAPSASAPAPQVAAEPMFDAAPPAPMLLDRSMVPQGGATHLAMPQDQMPPVYQDQGRDRFSEITANPVRQVADDPVSTFSVDVDTASYAFVRSSLNRGVLPPKDAVRIEEMVNYFDYDYPAPDDAGAPFRADLAILPTPWNDATKLLRIGIKGYEIPVGATPHANLVFLIDTSGSMNAPDKLPLLRNAFRLLVGSLKPDDTVSIVTYAGSAGTVLEPTRASDKAAILAALDRLSSGGSTAGAEGIRQAYQLAGSQFDADGVNRVILATDGDFNVGISDPEALKDFVERKRASGVSLSVLGFGRGNYNDELMQALAQNGNGNAAYIDTLGEARKVLVEEAGSTLFTIAKDVKLQLEFNPAAVSDYRLIGYETRQLARSDFNNDKVDAGDIGAGHTVTALYEFTPVGSEGGLVEPLRYQDAKPAAPATAADEFGYLKIRYKLPGEDTSKLIETPVTRSLEAGALEDAPQDARFAAAVAAFGQILRGGQYTGSYSYDDVIALAQGARGADPFNYRGEFVTLVRLAKSAAALEPQRR
ncbi:VWA domain-containing protein [Breoghania sp. L-A4]|uniref:vWA domain-containing protein n=1 Tax=Breoghania sp. L-A4 TaxID=2304600 RepID=UPI003204DD12